MTNRHPGMFRVGRAALLAYGLVCAATTQHAPTSLAADDSKKIAWRADLGQAQAEARSRNLLLWIQFTGPWCGNCRRMDGKAFIAPAVVAEARERFVPLKLRSDEHEELAQTLGLTMLPSTIIVRPNGEVVDKFEGYGEPDEFTKFLGAMLTQEGRSPAQVAARVQSNVHKDAAVALAGYDPVSLLQDQKLVPGSPDLTVEHDGRVFRFASAAGRDAFLRKPESFAPVNGGRCPVSQVDRGDFASGDPRWGVVYHGHLYLFRDVADRDRFAKDPERYARLDHSVRSTCPHCREQAPLARRISSRFSSMFAATSPPLPTVPQVAHGPVSPPTTATLPDRLASFLSLDSVLRR